VTTSHFLHRNRHGNAHNEREDRRCRNSEGGGEQALRALVRNASGLVCVQIAGLATRAALASGAFTMKRNSL
jgi:hypothetical protein